MNDLVHRASGLATAFAAFAALAALAALAPPAQAQTADNSRAERARKAAAEARERFAAADLDHDGKLTRAEADGRMPFVHQRFDQIDQGRKGYVTLEDLQAYTQQARTRRGGGATAAQ